MNYEEELRNALPRWMEDGLGLRGNAPVLFEATRNNGADGKAPFENARVDSVVPPEPLGNDAPAIADGDSTPSYAWIGDSQNNDGTYFAWLGEGDASFVTPDVAAQLLGLQIKTGDTGRSVMSLTVGSDDSTTDSFAFYGNGGNTLSMQWWDEPQITLADDEENNAVLDSGSLTFSDSASEGDSGELNATSLTFTESNGDTASFGMEGLNVGAVSVDKGGIEIGNVSLDSSGVYVTGSGSSKTSIEAGSVTIGDSVLSDGNLELGSSGTVTFTGSQNSLTMTGQQVTVCVNGVTKTMWVLGTTPQ